MAVAAATCRRYRHVLGLTAIMSVSWITFLLAPIPGKPFASQSVANVGTSLAALAAAVGFFLAARRRDPYRRAWLFLSAGTLFWGLDMVVSACYQALLGREVPFLSLTHVGHLAFPPLVAVALLSLTSASQSVAGRLRTVIDGLMIAGSMLLISWITVLDPLSRTEGDGLFPQAISLVFPLGDVVVVTMVLLMLLRGRQAGLQAFPIGVIGAGLVALSVADSGFTFEAATGTYAYGNIISVGWFAGFMLMFVAGMRPARTVFAEEAGIAESKPAGLLLPYVAVLLALVTSSLELLRSGSVDPTVSWIRTFIIVTLVARQILTLLENSSLTRHLQAKLVELRASEQRFEALVQHSSDVVTAIDADGKVLYQSESIEPVFGYLAEAVVGRTLDDLLDPASAERLKSSVAELRAQPYGVAVLELHVRHRAGHLCQAEMTITNLLDNPSVRGFVLNTRDISERKSLQDQLVYSAFHDSLTALANRALFRERVDETLGAGGANSGGLAVLFLDLDGFKQVNDLFGHACGDLLLVQVAERLRTCVRPQDTVARLGGDEFAVLLQGAEEHTAIDVAKRITASLRMPFRVDRQEMVVGGSVGVAIANSDVEDADELLRNADLAMYRAKAAGGSSYERYDPDMLANLVERLQLEADLRRAIDSGDLILNYQPIVSLKSGQISGVEALVRWKHPARGLLPPSAFIPLAEESGLITLMGRWVLKEACSQAAVWRLSHPEAQLRVSVNVSGRELHHGFAEEVARTLEQTGLPPDCLVLEMTESVLMDHTEENISVFKHLKDIGVRLAIDDFGTGYSSLSYLHRFPVDILKIDRSFVDLLGDSKEDGPELVRTVVRLAQSLGMRTVAEGIEEEAQAQLLRKMECELGQGYYFARPLSIGEIDRILDAGEVDSRTSQTGRARLVRGRKAAA